MKAEWMFTLNFDLAPEIHPEDAAIAYLTRIFASWGNKPAKLRKIVQDALLDSMANHRPWSEEQIKCVEELSQDQDFRERFGRALAQGRKPEFDVVDFLILRSWRVLDIKEIRHLPGLRYWHPAAAGALLAEYDDNLPGSEEWFVKRRKRLGLKPQAPYRVRNFRRNRNGKLVVDLD